jgi:hypothetical protein
MRKIVALAFAFLMAPLAAMAATPVPQAVLVPQDETTHAFGAAAHTLQPDNLAERGYVEAEYFLSGQANVYDWPASGAVVRTANAPYTNRVLVRMPARVGDFSGRVVVEMLNPSNMLDLNIAWAIHRDQILRRGDAWIGVTTKPISIATMKTFDPARYGPLSWANPLPASDPRNCDTVRGDTTQATENGLVWDIFTQTGAWIRSDTAANPFTYGTGKSQAEYLYAWGYSQTGGFEYTYINAIQPLVVAADGKPMFDGHLVAVSGGPSSINQCAERIAADDPRRAIRNAGTPVMHVMSQSDYLGYAPRRREDGNVAPDLYRDYDISGSGHATPDELLFGPKPDDIIRGGQTPPPLECDQGPRSRFPSRVGFNAILQNLQAWVEDGVAPPPGAVITVEGGAPVLDEHGNVTGGVRSPYVDVPTSTWNGNSTGASFCRIAGHEIPFDAAKLRSLYPTKDAYVRAVEASVRDLVAQRYIVKEDGDAIIAEARAFAIP